MKLAAQIGALGALLAVLGPGSTPAQDDPERELARVRAEIGRLERELERQLGQRDAGVLALREAELALATTRAEQGRLAAAVEAQAARSREITVEQRAATARLDAEQAALGDQVRMSYMSGRQELIMLLLSQEDPADLGRMLVYYDYLNRHRGERIAAVDAELARLAALATESEAVARELERLDAEQAARAAELETRQAERRTVLAGIESEIAESGGEIEQMRAEEAALNVLIVRLGEIAEGFPLTSDAPFAAQKGQLRWPIDGRLAARFGEPRDSGGRIRWDGVLIEAEAGTVVRAVYGGRVLHADWARGLGLLVIVDHGDGYMSLYGHNETLHREVGDAVNGGDTVAEVGNSGGASPGLYFEMRHQGKPFDPLDWVRLK